jgi:hypothetical protein
MLMGFQMVDVLWNFGISDVPYLCCGHGQVLEQRNWSIH